LGSPKASTKASLATWLHSSADFPGYARATSLLTSK